MKRLPITACACIALLATGARAQGSITLYGRLNLAAERAHGPTDAGSTPADRLSNYRSVVGLRGEEDLGDGLKAIWQIESAVSLDTGTGAFAGRDTRIGLEDRWGTLFAGQWTLPYTAATSGLDPFYPTTAGYMALLGNGSASATDNVINTSAFDRRQRNVVQYWTPTWQGLAAHLAYAFNEEVVATTGARPSLWSGSASYDHGPWQLSLSHEVHRAYQSASGSDQGTKFGLRHATPTLRLAAVLEQLRYDTPSGPLRRNAAYASAAVVRGAITLQGAVGRAWAGTGTSTTQVGVIRSGADTGATQFTVGTEYAFSKRTSAFAFYSAIHNEARAPYDFAINGTGVRVGASPSVLALGLRHVF